MLLSHSSSAFLISTSILALVVPFHTPWDYHRTPVSKMASPRLLSIINIVLIIISIASVNIAANAVDFPALLATKTITVQSGQYVIGSPKAFITQPPSAETIAMRLAKRVVYNTCSEWSILNGNHPRFPPRSTAYLFFHPPKYHHYHLKPTPTSFQETALRPPARVPKRASSPTPARTNDAASPAALTSG
jgi:hypothetical protein